MGHYDDYYDSPERRERERVYREADAIHQRLIRRNSSDFTVAELRFLLRLNWGEYKEGWNQQDLDDLTELDTRLVTS